MHVSDYPHCWKDAAQVLATIGPSSGDSLCVIDVLSFDDGAAGDGAFPERKVFHTDV